MGLFSGGNSKRTTNNETTNFNTSFGIGGDNTGLAISGDGNNIKTTDFGAIKGALSVVEEVSNQSLISNKDIVEQVLLGNTETNLAIAGLAAENGDNVTYLADATIAGNQALTETAMDNGVYLADATILGNQALTETAMNNNALLISQFGSDMFAMSDKNAALSQASMDNTAALSSQFSSDLNSAYSGFGADLTAVTESSIMANAQLTSEVNSLVGDISADSNQTLMEMAEMQSRGLDNALEIAGNMSMDDSAEASTDMIKYISIAAGIVAIAMVFK
ncbi:MAG: hypothetical protein JJV99_02215 [Colwellia sp.]|nr:hypothetical protein [Colwellia sp.]